MSLEVKQAMKLCIDGKKIKAASKHDENDFVIVYLDNDYVFTVDVEVCGCVDKYPEEFYFTDEYNYEVVKEKVVKYKALLFDTWDKSLYISKDYYANAEECKSTPHHFFRQLLESTAKEFEE